MTRRHVTVEERTLFEAAFSEARPLKTKGSPKPPAKVVKRSPAKKPKPTFSPSGLDGRTSERLGRGALEPEGRLDLHGYTQDAAHRALLSFLRGAQRRGLKLVLVVTGKGAASPSDAPFAMPPDPGRGILKTMVPRWLKEAAFAGLIADTRSAHRRHGGAGALYIYLRKLSA